MKLPVGSMPASCSFSCSLLDLQCSWQCSRAQSEEYHMYLLAAQDWLLCVRPCHKDEGDEAKSQDASIQPEVPAAHTSKQQRHVRCLRGCTLDQSCMGSSRLSFDLNIKVLSMQDEEQNKLSMRRILPCRGDTSAATHHRRTTLYATSLTHQS